KLTDEMNKLTLTVGGMRRMKRVPGAVFIIDPHRERIAVTEATKLEVPVVATGDTNVDPDEIDHIIPANDDASRSIRLLCQLIADACIEGQQERAARAVEPEPEVAITAEPEYDESASDELVAALAGGAALTFEPDADEEDLLPGARPAPAPVDAAAAAAKKSSREAREGLVSSYIHPGGRVGALVEVNCETDFVARTDEFQKLVRDLAVQVAALSPLYVDADAIPADVLEAKRAELLA